MKVIVTGFINTMSKPQKTAGFIYLPLHIAIIPLLVGMLGYYIPNGMDDLTANIIYYGIGLVFCLIAMWRYLRSAFDILLDNLMKNIVMIAFAYCIQFMLSFILTSALVLIAGDSVVNPNDEMVTEIASDNYRAALSISVFIAPIVEEILFRGVVFGSIRQKNRTWAYVISIALFAFYHVWQYAVAYQDVSMLIYAVQYIPAAYALAWSYEKTNCIWIPIFLHMFLNFYAMQMIV